MTESTTPTSAPTNDSAAAATRRLGLMLMSLADLLHTVNLATPTGLSASVAQELAHHTNSLGQYLASGAGAAVVFDRQTALGAYIGMSTMAADALRMLHVDVAGCLESEEQRGTSELLASMLVEVDAGRLVPGISIGDYLSQGLEKFVGEAPADTQA